MTDGTDVAPVVSGEVALAALRQRLTGAHAADLLRQAGGRLLVQLPVGVGKTAWLIKIISHVLGAKLYDLVIVLVPRNDILRELRRRLPRGLRPFVLRPRPRRRCGALDADWVEYERGGCAQLGREELCGACPLRQGCPWPDRHARIRGARLVLATQAQLKVNPQLVHHLRRQAGAARALVLFDESDFLMRGSERTISPQELDDFLAAQRAALAATSPRRPSKAASRWLTLTELVASAATSDLRDGQWTFPTVDTRWAANVQRAGRRLHGPGFRFLAFDLHALSDSDRYGREQLPGGGLRFALPPALGRDFIVFSGSIARELARYRLDPGHGRAPLLSPFEDLRVEHPGTRWFNLASLTGAACYFPGNAADVLNFFAEFIARNIRAGRRTLLVARKRFRRRCADHLRERLGELGVGPVKVVTGNWDRHDLADPRTLPLIGYGVSGVNRFEQFESVFCLCGYYVSARAVEQVVHDVGRSGECYPVTLGWSGRPRRRQAQVALPDGRETIVPQVARLALEQKEADVIVQAVGRVRPFTRPREVFTFHAGTLPGVRYSLEFESLAQARAYFVVQTRKQSQMAALAAEVTLRKKLGLPNQIIAADLNISIATVKRYARRGGGSTTL